MTNPVTPAATATEPTRRSAVSVRSALTAGAVGGLLASVVNVGVSLVARGPLGASAEFAPLTPGPIVMWTVLGVLIGALGWRLIVNRSERSGAALRTLVPTALGVSLLPDLAPLVTDALPATSPVAVASLMVMHVLTAVIAVSAYRRAMPTS